MWLVWRTYDAQAPIVKSIRSNTNNVYLNLSSLEYEAQKTLVFYRNNTPIACVCMPDKSIGNFKIAGIANMAVKHSYRENGIGTFLMDVAMFYTQKNNFDFSILYPSVYTKRNNFYNKFGYTEYKNDIMVKSFGGKEIPDVIDKIKKF